MEKSRLKKLASSHPTHKYRKVLAVLLFALVAVRLYVLTLDESDDVFYFVRQLIYTMTWLSMAIFLNECSMSMHKSIFEKHNITYMKRIAFMAMICCMARVIVFFIYSWPIVCTDIILSIHNIIELLVWIVFTMFFSHYWNIRRKQEALYNKSAHSHGKHREKQ